MQFAVQHDCANNATSYHTLATVLRFLAIFLLLLCVVVLFVTYVPSPFSRWAGPFSRVEAVVIAVLQAAVAWILDYAAKRLRSIAQIYEDLAKEFLSK